MRLFCPLNKQLLKAPLFSFPNSTFSTLPAILSAPTTFYELLDACLTDLNLVLGERIHARITVSALSRDSFLSTKLIALYSACGNIPVAQKIFDRIPTPCNVFQLNAMVRGYCSHGFYQEAFALLHRERGKWVAPDSHTFSCLLTACASSSDIWRGRELHGLAEDSGFGSDVFVCNSLICMYARCGALDDAVWVFEKMPHRDVVTWNSIVSAYKLHGFDLEAMEKVREMVGFGLRPDQVTIVGALTMCSISEAVVKEVHGYAFRNGYESASKVWNALISAYGKCCRTQEACRLFDSSVRKDRVTWNALISSYAQNGLFEESMMVLEHMKLSGVELDVVTYSGIISSLSQNDMFNEAMEVFEELLCVGLKPDVVAISSILPAVSGVESVGYCKKIHAYCFRHNLEPDRRVRNALIAAYTKCGLVQNAEIIFRLIKDRDVISWGSMVVGYAQNHYAIDALNTFRHMISANSEPNPITITSVLSACAVVSGLRQGKELHSWAVKVNFDGQCFVGSALIDMYAKCGRIKDSRRVFDRMDDKNVVTWNSMIGGYAVHGLGKDALAIFQRIREPDEVSFITILSACRHEGLVREGLKIFNEMKDFGVSPREEHYACMVDLLGRWGNLEEALQLIGRMPMKPSPETWGILLGACKVHLNFEIGVYTAEQIIESECKNSGYYVLLSNILADSGRWGAVEVMRELMKEKGVIKGAGCSWIEVDKGIQTFVAKERAQHPEWENLHRMLNVLNEQMIDMVS